MSVVRVPARPAQCDAFRDALVSDDFRVVRESEGRLELSRRVYLLRGDWPMRVIVERDGKHLVISYFMLIPWGWIIGLGVMMFLFLPAVAAMKGLALAFPLAILVMGVAAYKRRFDFSPDAWWQGEPRKLWNERMNRVLGQAFGKTAAEG